MIKLSLDSLTGFSTAPLRLATFAGFGGAVLAVLLVLYTLISRSQGHTVAGWTSTVAIVAGVGAVQLVCVGILGEYIGRMYGHMQGRPTYFIAYDSMTADTGEHGPTDTPLPAQPSEEHILTTTDESEPDTVTLLHPTVEATPQAAPQPAPQPAAPQPERTQPDAHSAARLSPHEQADAGQAADGQVALGGDDRAQPEVDDRVEVLEVRAGARPCGASPRRDAAARSTTARR